MESRRPVKFYHYAKCSTCRKAQKWLETRGNQLDPVDITTDPPGVPELRSILKASGKKPTDLLNTSGIQYRELNMKEKTKTLSEEQLLGMLSKNGRLIKRPLVSGDSKATIGFKEEEYKKTWK
jgi:arsenate reductase (glutaredoxin)